MMEALIIQGINLPQSRVVIPTPSNHAFLNHPSQPDPTANQRPNLVHLADEGVDGLLAVAKVTTLDEVLELAGAEAASGVAELEGPQEVGGLLEVGADGEDLVDEVLHADDAVLAEVLLDDGVVGQGDALLVDLAVAALVDELLDGLQVGVAVGDPGLDDLEHLSGGLGDLDEDAVVDLEETEELEDLAGLGGHLVDTAKGQSLLDSGAVDEAAYPLMRTTKISLASAGM